MLGILGLLGALVAGLAMDGQADDSETGREAEDAPESEVEAWGVSTAFMDEAPPADPQPEDEGLPTSDDIEDPADPDLALTGNEGDDVLIGKNGADTLVGAGGEDHLTGAGGADGMTGGAGDDTLWGHEGDDSLWGDDGQDSLAGCEGDDQIAGGAGDDTVQGGTGDDTLAGQAGEDLVDGSTGDDLLSGGDGADELEGGAGNDTIWGGFEAADDEDVDFLNGGLGDDMLHLGAGDYANGGTGADSFVMQDFAPGAPLVQITDFDPSEDQLVVMYDAELHPDPQLSVGNGNGATILMLDGVPVASLTNGAALNLAEIQLRAA